MSSILRFCASTALAAVVAFGSASSAFANGRFPRAQRLVEDRSDPSRLLLAATYGLAISSDSGTTWRLICESSYNFVFGEESDPIVDITADGSILASAFHSLNRSDSSGCNFVARLGTLENESVIDFSVETGGASTVIAVKRSFSEASGQTHQIYESTDHGGSWRALGMQLTPELIQTVLTLDAAPSDRNRLYVSGLDLNGNGILLRSVDRGQNWTSLPMDLDAASYEAPYIAAVDPSDADKIYVRTDYWRLDEFESEIASDRLLFSDSGGTNFSQIHQASGKLFGFALSPDAQTLLIGYGDPQVGGGRLTEPEAMGIYKSSTAGFSFSKIFEGSVSCLTWTERGVYACASQQEKEFELGFSTTDDFTLSNVTPFTPVLTFEDIRGPLDCPACTSGANCGSDWEQQCELFSACDVVPALPEPTDCTDGGLPDAGADAATGSGGSGGTGTATGGTSNFGASAGTGNQGSSDGGGCGCRMAPLGASRLPGAWLLAGFAVLLWRRCRR